VVAAGWLILVRPSAAAELQGVMRAHLASGPISAAIFVRAKRVRSRKIVLQVDADDQSFDDLAVTQRLGELHDHLGCGIARTGEEVTTWRLRCEGDPQGVLC